MQKKKRHAYTLFQCLRSVGARATDQRCLFSVHGEGSGAVLS